MSLWVAKRGCNLTRSLIPKAVMLHLKQAHLSLDIINDYSKMTMVTIIS